MLLYSWVGGLNVCVDLTGSSPLTQTEMANFTPGRAVIDAAQRKRVKYVAKCATIGYGGLNVCVDLTGSSPLTQTEMANFTPGRSSHLTQTGMVDFVPDSAMNDAAQRKLVMYEAKCADTGYGFLPFSFSSLGELEKDAVTLLKRIRKFSMTQDTGARADVHIFNRISFAIAKGVGAQIVSRFPSNFL
nr:hypothetical protein [Tanacetum cinerariifolium]